MIINKLVILISISCLVSSCMKNISEYPIEIEKHNLQQKYEEAKFIMYVSNYRHKLIYCDNDKGNYVKIDGILDCDLKLTELSINGDTTLMAFKFVCNNTEEYCRPRPFIEQIVFINGDSLVYRLGQEKKYDSEVIKLQKKIEMYTDTIDNKYLTYPLRIEVGNFKQFIQNKKELNPWLKKEAIKRGILKE